MFILDNGWIKKQVHGNRLAPCGICRKETPHQLVRAGFYLTVLETPVLSYKSRYSLICRVCGGGISLDEKQFKKILNEEQGKGQKPEKLTEYQKSRREGMHFCRHCGGRIRTVSSFCSHCGKKK